MLALDRPKSHGMTTAFKDYGQDNIYSNLDHCGLWPKKKFHTWSNYQKEVDKKKVEKDFLIYIVDLHNALPRLLA